MAETLFDELKRYVAFGPDDEHALRALHPVVRPHFERISEVFYARILQHEAARKALTGGESMVGRLRHTLVAWMDVLFSGPWDAGYYERRARIGRKHVDIELPQHYMFGAMSVLREELSAVIEKSYLALPKSRAALGKILDLELAIMMHTYREELLSRQARAERLSTFDALVGSIGRPLGAMAASLRLLHGLPAGDEGAKKHMVGIGEQIGIAGSIMSDLLDMIRHEPLNAKRLQLRDVVDAAARQIHLAVELESLDDLPDVVGDPSQLRQAFVNLLLNGQEAAGPGGRVSIDVEVGSAHIALGISDTGPGVDPAIRARLFEPLVTTRQDRLGLGLAQVIRVIERHGGSVVHAPRGQGARFVVRLPRKVD
jgi:signal transduction histidine kinase